MDVPVNEKLREWAWKEANKRSGNTSPEFLKTMFAQNAHAWISAVFRELEKIMYEGKDQGKYHTVDYAYRKIKRDFGL